jgi:hypothetical protein
LLSLPSSLSWPSSPPRSLKFGSMQVNIRRAFIQPTPQLQN